MPDIGMCGNKSCLSRKKCYRFMAVPNPGRQSYNSYVVPKRRRKCDSFVKIIKGDKLNKELFSCDHIKREGESCKLNNQCKYPMCSK